MIFRGLKTTIAIYLALLLLVAMFLVDLIVMTAAHRLMKSDLLTRSDALILSIQDTFPATGSSTVAGWMDEHRQTLLNSIRYASIPCLSVCDGGECRTLAGMEGCVSADVLREITGRALSEKRRLVRDLEITWGVFWKESRFTILAVPLRGGDGRIFAAAGVVLPMDAIYHRLRNVQKTVLSYIFINTGILTLIGLSGLSRVTVKPLRRLVKRADGYRQEGGMQFLFERDVSEFSRLSSSLNRMLARIAGDKEKLETTIASLERANRELRQAQQTMVRSEKFATIGRLSSGLAHEIGNPVGIVLGYIELLRQPGLGDDEKEGYLRRAEFEINRINTLIRQLLELSRPSRQDYLAVSVHAVIADLVDVVALQPAMAGIRVALHLDADKDVVLADAGQLRQVFLNLFLNAADAIASGGLNEKGEITVRSERVAGAEDGRRQERLRIKVVDNGPGIPHELMATVFDPFFTTKEPGKGTGLGLSVSYGIVEASGGTIEAVGGRKRGAEFVVTLPLAADGDIEGFSSRSG